MRKSHRVRRLQTLGEKGNLTLGSGQRTVELKGIGRSQGGGKVE